MQQAGQEFPKPNPLWLVQKPPIHIPCLFGQSNKGLPRNLSIACWRDMEHIAHEAARIFGLQSAKTNCRRPRVNSLCYAFHALMLTVNLP